MSLSLSKKIFLGGALAVAAAGLFMPAAQAGDVDAKALWKSEKCAMCHGDAGKGDSKIGKKKGIKDMTQKAWQKAVTDDMIRTALTKGIDRTVDGKKEKMKPMKQPTPENVEALLKLIRSFGK